MKKYVVAGLHGDEPFGLKVLSYLHDMELDDIETEIGNPAALAKRIRYLESDLNRSFNLDKESLESRIAARIQRRITQSQTDIVIDIHTSVSSIGRVGIVAEINPLVCYVGKQVGLETLILMPKHIAKNSLIGAFSDKAISIEYGSYNRSDKLAFEIAERISRLTFPKSGLEPAIPIFEVFGAIPKSFSGLNEIKNLQYNSELKGYPVLAGSNTYQDIGGFLAKRAVHRT